MEQMPKTRQHIICFVGPDMTGKTNISRELSRRTSIPRFKASSEHMTFTDEQDRFLTQLRVADVRQLDLLQQVGFSMIMDRGWPCEYVYAKFFDRTTDIEQLRSNDRSYAALGAQVVFCYHDDYNGFRDDLNPKIGPAELRRLHDLYEEFFELTRCPVVRLCVDDLNLDRQMRDLRDGLHIELVRK